MGILDIFKSNATEKSMKWNTIHSLEDLNQVFEASKTKKQMIFKHSTSCSISNMALNRTENNWDISDDITPHYLDLLNYRDLSNKIAEIYDVKHESPQVLIIEKGKCIYHNSHNGIRVEEIKALI